LRLRDLPPESLAVELGPALPRAQERESEGPGEGAGEP